MPVGVTSGRTRFIPQRAPTTVSTKTNENLQELGLLTQIGSSRSLPAVHARRAGLNGRTGDELVARDELDCPRRIPQCGAAL